MCIVKKMHKSCPIESIIVLIFSSFKVVAGSGASTTEIDRRYLPGFTQNTFNSPNGALGISAKDVI